MGVIYSAAFDVRALRNHTSATEVEFDLTLTSAGLGTIEIDADDFDAAAEYQLMHGYAIRNALNHAGAQTFTDFSSLTFAQALTAVITAKMAAVSPAWTGAIAVTFSANRYTIARTSGSFSFAVAGNPTTLTLLGYNGAQSSGTTHVATLTPSHWIDSTQGGRSDDLEGDFEPEGLASLAISDDATAFAGLSVSSSAKYRTWAQAFEIKAKVFKAFGESPDFWTFERLFEHCRTSMPFVVYDGDEKMICLLLASGSSFRGKRRAFGPGDDVHFHIPFACVHVADVAGGG
jgi:hypothetical protein